MCLRVSGESLLDDGDERLVDVWQAEVVVSAKSRQSCKQDCETVDFCNSLIRIKGIEKNGRREETVELSGRMRAIVCVMNWLN